MRPDILRTYRGVHTWTGIIAGLFLFVAFYAGALTVFKPALERWASPPAIHPVASLDQAHDLVARTIAAYPQARRDFSVHLGPDDTVPARLTWRNARDDVEQMAATLHGDGEVGIIRLHPATLGQMIDDLHRTAGLPVGVEAGAAVMGVVCILYVLALVSGVVIVLPSLVRDLFALRLGNSLKRLWTDAHNLVGLISLPFHLVIALTSVVFGLHDEIYGALDRLVYDGNLRKVFQTENPFAAVARDPTPAAMLPPSDLLDRLKAVAPDFQPQVMQYRDAGSRGASVTVWGTDERYLMRGRGFAVLGAVDGAIVNTEYLPGHQSGHGAVVAALFALHFASYGGPAVVWGYFALGLAGAFLFYSGNLLWIESRRRRDRGDGCRPRQSRATRWMAALTVGTCLGCVAGLSVCVVASKGLHGVGTDPDGWLWHLYYGVVLSFLAWAFFRGAGRAGAELLWAAAMLTAAIPVTSGLAWAIPALGLWAWGDSLGVDAVALAGAVLLGRLAQATARRARQGADDSVWSAGSP